MTPIANKIMDWERVGLFVLFISMLTLGIGLIRQI